MSVRVMIATVFIGLASSLGAIAQNAGAPPADAIARQAATSTVAQRYILGPSDVIEVGVQGRTDYTSRQRIGEDGSVQLQYLGRVQAADKTTLQLANEIAEALDKGGYFMRPVVVVEVASYASRYVVVLGNVGTPGLVPVDRPYHLSEIVARVGGIRESGADYVILRSHNGGERRLSIVALATGDSSEDPYVSPGDKIYSPNAETFYISGQVKAPGAYAVQPNMSVRMAIARGGGLTDSGNERRLSLTRGGKKVDHVPLESKIAPSDVLVVGERLF